MIGGSWFALTLVSFDQVDLTAVADEHLPSPLSLVLTLLLRIEPDELPDCSTPQADATNLDVILSRRSKYGIMAHMTTPLRIVFMGTPEFAVPSLQALLEADPEKTGRVVGVVTQPDRPKGRGQQLSPPPVEVLAQEAGLPILQPLKMKDPAFLETLKSCARSDRRHGLRPDSAPRRPGRAAEGMRQRARFATSQVPGRRPDPVGDHQRRDRDRHHHDANGCGHGHGPRITARDGPDPADGNGRRTRGPPGAHRRTAAREDHPRPERRHPRPDPPEP